MPISPPGGTIFQIRPISRKPTTTSNCY